MKKTLCLEGLLLIPLMIINVIAIGDVTTYAND